MTPTACLATGFLTGGSVVFAIVGIVIVIFLFFAIWSSRYTKVGPNQVLVISGLRSEYSGVDGRIRTRGFRIVKGGGTFVLPVVEKIDVLTLEPVTLEFRFTEVGTVTRDRVSVSGVAQVKIKGDDLSIIQAAEYFLSKGPEAIRSSAAQIVESQCRKVLAGLALEEVLRAPAAVGANIEEQAASELGNMGLALMSFNIRSLSQNDPVLAGTGKPPISATT